MAQHDSISAEPIQEATPAQTPAAQQPKRDDPDHLEHQASVSSASPATPAANWSFGKITPFAPSIIRPKLAVSHPDDDAEREAERAADHVMRMASPGGEARPLGSLEESGILHRAASRDDTPTPEGIELAFELSDNALVEPEVLAAEPEEGPPETAPSESSELVEDGGEPPVIMRRAKDGGLSTGTGFESRLASAGDGQTLSPSARAFFEPRFGFDFGQVHVHADAPAANLAKEINAHAFTQGSHIFFGEERYDPSSQEGRRLLAHELSHVVQGAPGTGTPSIQRRNGGAKKIRYAFYINLDRVLTPEELKITAFTQVFGVSKETAKKYIDYGQTKGWQWTLSPVTAADVGTKRRFTMDKAIYDLLRGSGGGGKPGEKPGEKPSEGPDADREAKKAQRAKAFKGASAREHKKINEATDEEFWKRTNYKVGKKLGHSPEDQQQALLWLDIRDEFLEKREKIKELPKEIKELMGGEEAFDPEDYDQLLRIGWKIKDNFTSVDIEIYKLIAQSLTSDLDVFEKSIEAYIQFRDQCQKQLVEAAEAAQKQPQKEKTLEEKLTENWKSVDFENFGKLSRDEKEALAREMTARQTGTQLKHMATHPGETVGKMAEGLVRVDKVAKGIIEDVKEAANGSKSAFARFAGATGAVGKLAGWIAGVAAVIYVVLLFVPGVNAVQLAATALTVAVVAGTTAIVASTVEGELRIQAAAEAKDPKEFQEHVDKASAAFTMVAMAAALMVIGAFVPKILAPLKLGDRLHAVRGALSRARSGLKGGKSLDSVKQAALSDLAQQKAGLPEALAKESKAAVADPAAKIRSMSGDQILQKAVEGDALAREVTGLSPEAAKQIQQIAKTPAGKNVPETLRRNILKGLEDTPAEAKKYVDRFLKDVESAEAAIKQSSTAAELEKAIGDAEAVLDPSKQGKAVQAQQEAYKAQRIQSAKYERMGDAELRTASKSDPLAAEELTRRYQARPDAELETLAKDGDPIASKVLSERKPPAPAKPAPAEEGGAPGEQPKTPQKEGPEAQTPQKPAPKATAARAPTAEELQWFSNHGYAWDSGAGAASKTVGGNTFRFKLDSSGRWVLERNGTPIAREYDTAPYKNRPSGAGGTVQAHHPIQDAWALDRLTKLPKNSVKDPTLQYKSGEEPSINLRNSYKDSPHQKVTARQAGRKGDIKTRNYAQERAEAVKDLTQAGVPPEVQAKILAEADAYFKTLHDNITDPVLRESIFGDYFKGK